MRASRSFVAGLAGNEANPRGEGLSTGTVASSRARAAIASGQGMVVGGVYLMFFCSGLASLICEVIWFKQLQFLLGSATFAVSVVVSCFFGGLGFGSWLAGRLADRWHRPLRAYAFLELSLGLIAAGTTLLLAEWQTWVEWLAPWLGPQSASAHFLAVLVSLVILLPPTSLMGATLPVLARHLVRQRSVLAQRIGTLYGVNTLGAASGCILVGFVLIPGLGVMQSALLAAAIYETIAIGALLLGRGDAATQARPVSLPRTPAAGPSPEADVAPRLLMMVFALMGLTSIAYEVLWFRILACFSMHSVYAFSGMLATYLLGLVLGSLLCARYLAPRRDRHLVYFARLQLLVACAAMISLAMLGRSPGLLDGIAAVQQTVGLSDSLSGVSTFVLLCLLILLLPTTLIGIGFPLAAELTVPHLTRLGSRLGGLYSLNTLGGVVGSLLAGFVLLPLLGSGWSFMVIVALNLGLFLVLLASQPSLRSERQLWREGALVTAALGASVAYLGGSYLEHAQTQYEGATVLSFRENADATFVVLGYDSPHCGPFQQLLVNGTSYANNSPPGRRYMSTLGHLPALAHPQPRAALVIAIGTGTTVGTLTLHREIEDIYAVDIASEVFQAAPYFVPLNNRFHESPRVRKVAADGRHFLLCTDHTFDLLTFEPPPPADTGIVNLYSREFYQLAKRRMKPGAILAQWMPLDIPRELLPRMMLRTLMAEFPHVSLWIPNRMEGVALASLEPLRIDPDQFHRRMSEPTLQADLTAYGLGESEQLLAAFVAADNDLARLVGPVPVVTDNRPRIEYFNFYPQQLMRFADILPHRQPIEKYLAHPLPDPERLENCRQVVTHIWYSHEAESDGRYAEAMRLLQEALRLDPGNRYLLFQRAKLAERVP
jgi:spermidine synthase